MFASVRPILDHVVVNARDALAEAAALFERLGFVLTAPSRHTLGSVNRTAVLAREYLELVGIDPAAATPREELLRTPMGFEGLVFATEDADRLHRALLAKGIPATAPIAFARGVGAAEARFRVVRLAEVPFGRCYFCQHLTPELVWRPEWQRHPNGALAIRRVVIAARDPAALASLFRRMFDDAAMDQLEFAASDAKDAIAGIELAVRSIEETRRALDERLIDVRSDAHRITVQAMGAALSFSER